jgi:hypothetical protein
VYGDNKINAETSLLAAKNVAGPIYMIIINLPVPIDLPKTIISLGKNFYSFTRKS